MNLISCTVPKSDCFKYGAVNETADLMDQGKYRRVICLIFVGGVRDLEVKPGSSMVMVREFSNLSLDGVPFRLMVIS